MSNRDDNDRRTTAGVEEDTRTGARNEWGRGKWVSGLIALVGLWMLIQSLLFEMITAQLWNDVVIGLLLLAVGGYNYYRQTNGHYGSVGAASVAALIGLWLILAPFVFGQGGDLTAVPDSTAFWNDIVIGLLTFALGAYSAYRIRDWQRATRRTAT